MQRRNLIKGTGAFPATHSNGRIGLLANTGPASATAQSSIEDTETVATDDGEIQYINTKTARRVSWDGFEKPVKYTQIFVGVELYQNGNQFATKWIHDTDIFSLTGTWSAPRRRDIAW